MMDQVPKLLTRHRTHADWILSAASHPLPCSWWPLLCEPPPHSHPQMLTHHYIKSLCENPGRCLSWRTQKPIPGAWAKETAARTSPLWAFWWPLALWTNGRTAWLLPRAAHQILFVIKKQYDRMKGHLLSVDSGFSTLGKLLITVRIK
jgi:hypothetical protein